MPPVAGRVGRPAYPGESTVQMLRERPEVLEEMARRWWATEHGLFGLDALEAWAALEPDERARWIDSTFESSSAQGARYDEGRRPDNSPNPDGGGGEPLPVVVVRAA